MGLIHEAVLQAQIWRAFLRLKSPDDSERTQAMETLRAAGSASLACLRYAANRADAPRVQFAAAVVLHWLGEPQGMATLIEAVQWRLPGSPGLSHELEAAFLTIGSPDAVTALLALWEQLPDWGDHDRAMATICRIWARLRDPRVLDALTARATRIPTLFLETLPAFGEMAVLHLQRMLRESEASRRILAVRGMGRVASGRGFALLLPLLRDPDPQVRAEVPAALEMTGGSQQAAIAIAEAMRAGYSTREAVETLTRVAPPYYHETLLELVCRWNPRAAQPSGDTGEAVLAALSALASAPGSNGRLVPPLCDLLERSPGPAVLAAVAKILGARCPAGEAYDRRAKNALWPLLAHADKTVRDEAASALARMGEPKARQWMQWIEVYRPQGSLLDKVQTVLRGGPDAGLAASQAMQQVSQWVSRFSRETAERLSAVGSDFALNGAEDARLPELLCRLLGNTLDTLEQSGWPEETEEMLSCAVAIVRVFGRIGASVAPDARPALLRALHLVKYSVVFDGPSSAPFRKSERREVGHLLRLAAAETLRQLYGGNSFPLFLEALYAPQKEIHGAALFGLGRLGDVRALPHLQSLANKAGHPLAREAQEAMAAIRRTNPELMELLRASHATDTRADTLLRPASGNPADASPDILLRPAE
jgi:HEAT repeat protein